MIHAPFKCAKMKQKKCIQQIKCIYNCICIYNQTIGYVKRFIEDRPSKRRKDMKAFICYMIKNKKNTDSPITVCR